MATFVLFHGMWAGGWYWQRVRPRLGSAGHAVVTPTLTGLGERAHLTRPEVDLDTHILDVVNCLRYDDLRDVVLVGHSYAGMAIFGVADRVPDRLRLLVYLDALVPDHGDCVLDIWPAALRPDFVTLASRVDGVRIPTPDPEDEDPALVAWENGRTVPHPLATFQQPIQLRNGSVENAPRVFIHCLRKPDSDGFERSAERARRDAGWTYLTLGAAHDVMATDPELLATALLTLA